MNGNSSQAIIIFAIVIITSKIRRARHHWKKGPAADTGYKNHETAQEMVARPMDSMRSEAEDRPGVVLCALPLIIMGAWMCGRMHIQPWGCSDLLL